jgi:hypothetical protein
MSNRPETCFQWQGFVDKVMHIQIHKRRAFLNQLNNYLMELLSSVFSETSFGLVLKQTAAVIINRPILLSASYLVLLLSRMKRYVGFLSIFRQILGKSLKQATPAPFCTLPTLSFSIILTFDAV